MQIPVSQNEKVHPGSVCTKKILTIAFSALFTFFFSHSLLAQNIRVRGHVTNENGQPVQKPSITIKGTANGATGNENGDFEIMAPGNATLVISSVGFTSLEVPVNNRSSIPVSLTSVTGNMNEVVVVGYGTQRKKDVTGSIASVSATTLKEVPSPNLIDQLKGRTAGVDIVSNSTTPGSSGQIRIRGNRTLTTSQSQSDALDAPLIVVDGIPYSGNINDISPEDIAGIDILKDASATAIYGSRGAGGVIIITTKRGRTGKPVMTFDSYYGVSNIMGKYDNFNGQQYAQFKADAATYNRTSPGTTAYALTAAEQAALAAGISTDWQDLIYKQGFTTSNQLGLSGGNETTQYGLGFGYYDQTNVVPNQNFERYSVRTTIDHKINKFLKIGLNSINALEYINNPGGNVSGGLVRLTPLASPYNSDGSINLKPAVGSIDDPTTVSPLTLSADNAAILNRTRRISTINSIYGEVQILPGLRYRFQAGLSFRQENGNTYNGPNVWTNAAATTQSASNASISNTEAWNYDLQNLVYYDKTFATKHKIGFTGLFETIKDHSQSSSFNATGVPADYILNSNFSLANSVVANAGNFSESGLVSYMGRLNYGFDNRFLATATVRVDGSSTLSPGHQYFTYPAFAGGWNISNEKFMSSLPFINVLKLRGGWGISGNRNVSPYATLGLLSSGAAYTYNFGTSTAGQQSGVLVTSLANNSLKWQSTSQWDWGLDFSLFKNRLSGSVDIYQQKTKNILLSVNLPYSNGAGTTLENLGKTKGNGIEINLSSINVQTRSGFTWSTDLNFYFNREKITELTTPDEKSNIGNGWFVGQPLTVIYDLKKIGIWQTSDSAKGILATQTAPIQFPGQIRVQDLNGDGKINGDDRQVLGNFEPQWEGGITNRVSYKQFDLSFVIYARMGMKVLVPYLTDDGGANGFPFFMQGRVDQLMVNYWTRTNPTNEFPAPDAGTDRFPFASTLGYRDGSFIKCRSINLGFTLPESILSRTSISSLRVYFNITNPFIIYSPLVKAGLAIDPEGNGY
ncbi:MAG TPA: TonB-dependent receptor, partial [Chitinophagaceae bacterium]|nr:TonB-dependent receptor [Chitinophagaceae bacterium]